MRVRPFLAKAGIKFEAYKHSFDKQHSSLVSHIPPSNYAMYYFVVINNRIVFEQLDRR